jgi:hypothetical protein
VSEFRRAADAARERGRNLELVHSLHNVIIQSVFGGERWLDEEAE